MIDPTTYAEWELLNQVNRHRLKLFSEGKFQIGLDDPETFDIEDHETLMYSYHWATIHLRQQKFGYQIARDILKYHLESLNGE